MSLECNIQDKKYAIPLFFVATTTNVDYQVIGSFAIQNETMKSIIEGLHHLKQWNQDWNLKVILVDYCEEKIKDITLKRFFPGKIFYLFRIQSIYI